MLIKSLQAHKKIQMGASAVESVWADKMCACQKKKKKGKPRIVNFPKFVNWITLLLTY